MKPRTIAVAATLTLLAVSCGSDDDASSDTAESADTADTAAVDSTPAPDGSVAAVSLADVCPEKIVIQTDWFPEAEHGALYQMIGDDYEVDGDNNVVSGTLVDSSGGDTGVQIEVRSGGPSVGFQGPDAQMYTDDSITMGYSGSGAGVNWDKTPLLSVVAPLEKNPQMIMWDPETYPDVTTIDELNEAGVTVNVFAPEVMALFVSDGRYDASLIDPSYDGGPARFIAEGGKIAQQGFVSAEPYQYENEFADWGKPVAYQSFFDAGYQDYSQTIGIRPDDLETLRPCLERFVPIVQQAAVDFINSPEETNALIVDAVAIMDDFWVYGPEVAAFSAAKQLEEGLVSNGPDSTLGNFDLERVQTFIDQLVATGEFTTIPEGFTADMMVTNEFIDPSIGL